MNSSNIKRSNKNYIRANLLRNFNRFVREMIEDRELVSFTRKLKPGAKFAIFGGMLRDISLSNQSNFSSDIDVVVDQKENTDFVNILKEYETKINSFGGFRVKVGRWYIDLWMLENTWAFKQGLVKEKSFKSLINTTFFNWDAIALELGNKKKTLYCKETYFEDLEKKYLTINLEENPNSLGVIAKTLRHFIIDNANISKELANYVICNINASNKQYIYSKTSEMSKIKGMSKELIDMALKQIHEDIDKENKDVLSFVSPQLELSFKSKIDLTDENNINAQTIKDNLSKRIDINFVNTQIPLI